MSYSQPKAMAREFLVRATAAENGDDMRAEVWALMSIAFSLLVLTDNDGMADMPAPPRSP